MEEAKERTELERAEVSNLREGVRRDREAFEKEVATLRELAQKVNEESVRVREAARVSEHEVAEARTLHEQARTERATAEAERARAEQAAYP